MTGRQGRLWRIPSESWTPSRSRSAAALSLIRSSTLSKSGTIPSGAGLPKLKPRRGRRSHSPRESSQTGNGHNRFQSRRPWAAPLEEGATIHQSSRCVAPCRGRPADSGGFSEAFQLLPILTGEATLPLRWLPPATLLWICRPETSCAASCSRSASLAKRRLYFAE